MGASPNSPGNTFPATTGSNGTTNYTKGSTRSQNGVDRVVTNREVAGGTLIKQSVSVQVSDEIAAGDVQKIQAAVEAAVGYDQARGDNVTVASIAFAKDALATKNAAGTETTATAPSMDIMGIAKTAAAAIGLLMILMMARKSLKRRQTELEKALPELLSRGPVPVGELAAVAAAPRRRAADGGPGAAQARRHGQAHALLADRAQVAPWPRFPPTPSSPAARRSRSSSSPWAPRPAPRCSSTSSPRRWTSSPSRSRPSGPSRPSSSKRCSTSSTRPPSRRTTSPRAAWPTPGRCSSRRWDRSARTRCWSASPPPSRCRRSSSCAAPTPRRS